MEPAQLDRTPFADLDAMPPDMITMLVAAQEAERTRVAREMHDQLGQHLVGLSLGGYVAMTVAGRHPEKVRGLVIAGSTREPVGLSRLVPHHVGERRSTLVRR